MTMETLIGIVVVELQEGGTGEIQGLYPEDLLDGGGEADDSELGGTSVDDEGNNDNPSIFNIPLSIFIRMMLPKKPGRTVIKYDCMDHSGFGFIEKDKKPLHLIFASHVLDTTSKRLNTVFIFLQHNMLYTYYDSVMHVSYTEDHVDSCCKISKVMNEWLVNRKSRINTKDLLQENLPRLYNSLKDGDFSREFDFGTVFNAIKVDINSDINIMEESFYVNGEEFDKLVFHSNLAEVFFNKFGLSLLEVLGHIATRSCAPEGEREWNASNKVITEPMLRWLYEGKLIKKFTPAATFSPKDYLDESYYQFVPDEIKGSVEVHQMFSEAEIGALYKAAEEEPDEMHKLIEDVRYVKSNPYNSKNFNKAALRRDLFSTVTTLEPGEKELVEIMIMPQA